MNILCQSREVKDMLKLMLISKTEWFNKMRIIVDGVLHDTHIVYNIWALKFLFFDEPIREHHFIIGWVYERDLI